MAKARSDGGAAAVLGLGYLKPALGSAPATPGLVDAVRTVVDKLETFSIAFEATGEGTPVAGLPSIAGSRTLPDSFTIEVAADR